MRDSAIPAFLAAVAAAALLAGCAPQRPVLYPNAKLQQVGMAVAQQDVEDCIALARQSGAGADAGAEVAQRTVTASAIGAAGGAAAGAVHGNAGRGAAAGAAGGAAVGLTAGLLRSQDLDPVTKRWVEACLQERGYRTVGWK